MWKRVTGNRKRSLVSMGPSETIQFELRRGSNTNIRDEEEHILSKGNFKYKGFEAETSLIKRISGAW